MKIGYKGYEIIQSNYNNHITIFKDNIMVIHISATEKFTKTELQAIVELYLLRD